MHIKISRLSERSYFSKMAKGFTLVELLVVIAIITILAAMLLPVLEKSLSIAKQTTCANNLHQLTLSYGMYIDDYSGSLALYAWYDGTIYHNTMKDPHWYGILAPYLGDMRDPNSIMNPVQWCAPSRETAHPAVRCPSATNPQAFASTVNQWYYTNYGHNRGVIRQISITGIDGFYNKRITNIINPSRTMCFFDAGCIDNTLYLQGMEHTVYLSTFSPALGGRVNWLAHDYGANFGFMDGRVEYRREGNSRLKWDWFAKRKYNVSDFYLFQ